MFCFWDVQLAHLAAAIASSLLSGLSNFLVCEVGHALMYLHDQAHRGHGPVLLLRSCARCTGASHPAWRPVSQEHHDAGRQARLGGRCLQVPLDGCLDFQGGTPAHSCLLRKSFQEPFADWSRCSSTSGWRCCTSHGRNSREARERSRFKPLLTCRVLHRGSPRWMAPELISSLSQGGLAPGPIDE